MTKVINENLYSKARFWSIPTKHKLWTEYYITVIVDSPIDTDTETAKFFGNIFSFLNKNGIQILQEKLYGISNSYEKIMNIRNEQFKKLCPDYEFSPTTFIEGSACLVKGLISGVQIIGISSLSENCKVESVNYDGNTIGKTFKNPYYKSIFLSGMSGGLEGETEPLIRKVSNMFINTQKILEQESLSPQNIVRTWIYFPRLLDWYGEFNKGRTRWFKDSGLITESGAYLPASTGIQGKRFEAEECYMDVLGISINDHKNVHISVMKNIRQNEAKEYGSSFSRGMSVKVEEQSTLFISGTASINNKGKNVYCDDSQGQILETFLNVAALLDTSQAKLKEIVLATAYCKTSESFENFKNIIKLLDMENIPFLPVYADVCRDELLFETDCIAVKN